RPGSAVAGTEAVRGPARTARLQPAPGRRHPARTRRAPRPLDHRVPRLHPLPGHLPDDAGAARTGAAAVGGAARLHPPAGAVRVRRPGARHPRSHRRVRARVPPRHPRRDRRHPGARGLRAIAVAGVHEGTGPGRRAARPVQRGPLRGDGGARPAGTHGRGAAAATGSPGDRRRPRHADHGPLTGMDPLTALTHALPHRVLSSLARRVAYSRHPRVRRSLIDTVVRRFGVDLEEAAESDPAAYDSFNAFFTRALRAGARAPDPDPRALLMPADGRISQCGTIEDGRIFQAKGRWFTAAELLGDGAAALPFDGGVFATVYLSPRDYHRVHMPWDGTLREPVHIPGRLFSVGPAAVRAVPRLFARNERLVCHFETDFGPMAVVMVGALLVSGVETVWSGEEIPAYGDRITSKAWAGEGIVLERFEEMARFNYGSTVIVLLPPGVATLEPGLRAEQAVCLGEALARRQ